MTTNQETNSTSPYNALILKDDDCNDDGTSKIVARLQISDKTKLPPTWIIRYGNEEIPSGKLQNSNLIRLASSAKPLLVYPNGVLCSRPFQITVKTLKGNTIKLLMKSSDTINDLKLKIEESEDTAIDHQRFVFKKTDLLDNEKTLNDYQITLNSILRMTRVSPDDLLVTFQIFIAPIKGEPIKILTRGKDTIEEIKLKIQEINGIPVKQQKLEHLVETLLDEKTVNDYKITFNSVLYLIPLNSHGIPVERPNQIFVRFLGKMFNILTSCEDTIENFKKRIEVLLEVPVEQQRLIWAGRQLKDFQTFEELRIENCSTMDLVKRLRGGRQAKPLITVDLESTQIQQKISYSEEWLQYKDHLNVLGRCPETRCVSNQQRANEVVRQCGLGYSILTPYDHWFPCPACPDGTFAPSNFLVSKGRVLFRFRKVDDSAKDVKQVILESIHGTGTEDGFAIFNSTQKAKVEYEIIETTTVDEDGSPFYCVKCGDEIGLKRFEMVLECGHAYHRNCYRSQSDCIVCKVPVWTNEEKFDFVAAANALKQK